MKQVPAKGHPILGVDISHWETSVDFVKLSKAVSFCFMKATEGPNYRDPMFYTFWSRARNNGIIRGAYHFFHPKYDAITQAKHFVEVVGKLESDDMPLVMDWEVNDNYGPIEDAKRGLIFLREVEVLTGRRPIIYSSPYFLQDLVNRSKELGHYPLWVANYGVVKPHVPDPWLTWDFWQYTEKGRVQGIEGFCDVNYFNGSLDELKKFVAGGQKLS